MTVRLILITHAPTGATHAASFPADEPLTDQGHDAARAAAGGAGRVGAVLRGPEARCAQTAAALGLVTEPGSPAVVEPALADLDAGSWRGLSLERVETIDPAGLLAWLTDPDAAPHRGEPITALLARVAGFLAALPRAPSQIAAITHPAVVRAAVLHVLGAPATSFWSLDVAPLTHARLSWNADRWRLRETGHPLTGRPHSP